MSEPGPACRLCGATNNLKPSLKGGHICVTCAVRNLENGLGMKLVPVGDGCEWNPYRDQPAFEGEPHTLVPATLIVGAQGNWRLCDECAKLPRFRRYRVRKQIQKARPTP